MTIIVACKYDAGVLVGYDTANLQQVGDRYKYAGAAQKFREVGKSGLGMGLSGLVDGDYFSDLEKILIAIGDRVEAIRKFLRTVSVDSCDLIFFPDLLKQFVFASHNSLRTGDNNHNCNTEERDYLGVGFGFYPPVKEMLQSRFHPNMPMGDAICVIKDAIGLSTRENMKDVKYKKGYLIRGFGLVQIEKNRFETLEFSAS